MNALPMEILVEIVVETDVAPLEGDMLDMVGGGQAVVNTI